VLNKVPRHEYVTLVLNGGEWSATFPNVRVPGTHWIWSWVRPRCGGDHSN